MRRTLTYKNNLLDTNFTFKDDVRKVTEALAKKINFEKIDIENLKLNNSQQKDSGRSSMISENDNKDSARSPNDE